MADPKAPEMPEGWDAVCAVPGAPVVFRRAGPGYRFVTLEVIRQLLATQRLHIVSEADKRVLDALSECDVEDIDDLSKLSSEAWDDVKSAALARRKP